MVAELARRQGVGQALMAEAEPMGAGAWRCVCLRLLAGGQAIFIAPWHMRTPLRFSRSDWDVLFTAPVARELISH
jgi:GNAT superfamily N-acetyltransferase